MKTCPGCGKQTEGVNHNGRGLRCTFCFARLIEPGQGDPSTGSGLAAAQIASEPKPEYSPPPAKEVEPELEKGKGKWPSRTSTRS